MDYITAISLLIILALLPWSLYFIYYSKLKTKHIEMFIVGAVGWLGALLFRLPILTWVNQTGNLWLIITVSPLLAGIFEEGVRFLLVRKTIKPENLVGAVLSFGIGWGTGEILVLHTLTLVNLMIIIAFNISVPGMSPLPPPDQLFYVGLIGCYERWIAVAAHVAFTLIIIKAVPKRYLYLATAILGHFILDFGVVLVLYLIKDAILVEVTATALAVGLYLLLAYLKLPLKEIFTKPTEESLTIVSIFSNS